MAENTHTTAKQNTIERELVSWHTLMAVFHLLDRNNQAKHRTAGPPVAQLRINSGSVSSSVS